MIEGVARKGREACDKDDRWALRVGECEQDRVKTCHGGATRTERGNANKTDEIAHWCFDMGQIMFDTGRGPCLVWLIARYMYVRAFFRRFDTHRRGTSSSLEDDVCDDADE